MNWTEYPRPRDDTPIVSRYEGPFPDPRYTPEPQYKGGWIIAAATVIVMIGMAFVGAIQ